MVDQTNNCWKHWNDCITPYAPVHAQVFGNIYVNTLETQRLTAILDLVVPNRRAVCFVGGAGTGKTTIMKDKLRNIDQDTFFTLGSIPALDGTESACADSGCHCWLLC
jgi:hypothetical protein